MRSEIQIQLAGLLIDVLFLPQIETPQCSVALPYHVFLEEHMFQNNMCTETTLGEFANRLILVISCEPVNVETESRNF